MSYDKISAASVWWDNQQVSKRFLEDLKTEAVAYRHFVVPRVPWHDYFWDVFRDAMRDNGFSVYRFDCSEYTTAPSGTMLDCVVDKIGGLSAEYDGDLESIVDELGKAKYVWYFWNLNDDQCDELFQLSQALKQQALPVSLIIETVPVKLPEMKEIKLPYSSVDLYFFTWELLMQKENPYLIEYKAMLINQFAHGDPVRIAECCKEADNCIYSPGKVCKWLTKEQIEQDQYRAQLRFLWPKLETARYEMCQRFKDRLCGVEFPMKERYNNNPRSINTYASADEFEFRHWVNYNDSGNIHYLDRDEKEWLKVLHKARNDLAHIQRIDTEDNDEMDRFRKIIDYCEKLHLE